MENNQNANWTPPAGASGFAKELEGASASQTMGIIGLVLSLCTGCGVIGFILSIVAFVKGKAAVSEYEQNPTAYTEKSYNQAKTGKLLGLIGLILGIVVIVVLIIAFATGMLAEAMKK